MKLGIMQPYFFPYLGYYSLIKNTDRFILLDSVQFIYHGWVERNRILKPNDGWQYIRVPLVKHSQTTLIKDIVIDNRQPWRRKILSQLQHYKRAPYFYKTINLVENILDKEYNDIVSFNNDSLIASCRYLGIDTEICVFSKMILEIEQASQPDEWALNICKALGNVKEYWNPPGGKSFFNQSKYDKNGIALKFQSVILQEYDQKRGNFEPGLSIIDVMMFNSVEQINKMLDRYVFI